MRTTIAPVDEADTEFLINPPRSLFPEVHEDIAGVETVGTMLFESGGRMEFEDNAGDMLYENAP